MNVTDLCVERSAFYIDDEVKAISMQSYENR